MYFPRSVLKVTNSGRSLAKKKEDHEVRYTCQNAAFINVCNIPKHSKGSENSCSQKSYLTLEPPFSCNSYWFKRVCNQTSQVSFLALLPINKVTICKRLSISKLQFPQLERNRDVSVICSSGGCGED